MKKHALRTVFIILILVFVFAPIMKAADSTARNEIPSMNDAWYESIKGIKENSTDAIITSWWDFGHWFVAVAERRVTFDGGNQGKRIHWVGKSLLTSDENEAVGILRMLNCGQEEAGNALVKYMKNDTVKAVEVLKRILLMERAEAEKELADNGLSQKAVGEVIELTHCEDLIDQYYITSEDMIGKAGVWGHFGSWNFTKASMYNKVIRKNQENGVRILINDFGIDEEEAENLFFEIKNADPDRWISPWPGYMGTGSCSVNNNVVDCDKGAVIIDLDDMTVLLRSGQNLGVPHSLVYADEEGVKEKVFNNSNIEVSVALIPDGNSYKSILMDPLQATGMFTKLFFFKGHGLECFDLLSYKKSFRNNEIYVWKLDWNCEGKNVVYEDEKSANIDVPENGNATDTTMNNTDNESEQ